jgi:hypothetical protein
VYHQEGGNFYREKRVQVDFADCVVDCGDCLSVVRGVVEVIFAVRDNWVAFLLVSVVKLFTFVCKT